MKVSCCIVFLALILFAACNGIEISSDYDKQVNFSSYKSFSVCVEDLAIENDAQPAYDNMKNRLLIADAIVSEMKRYYTPNDTTPELRAGFHIIINKQKLEYRNCSRANYYRTWPECRIDTIEYTEGTLVIYISDVSKNQVIWQASAIGAVGNTVESSKKIVDKAVAELFGQFPLKAKN